MIPVKDKYLRCWVVWEIHKNIMIDKYHGKTKKECMEWIKKHEKK